MTNSEPLSKFQNLNVWKSGAKRAPHKPLLVLLLLGRIVGGKDPETRFVDIQEPLTDLLREFGPDSPNIHPEYPFWHLQSDDVWQVEDADSLELKKGGSSPPKGELIRKQAAASFTPDVLAALRSDPSLTFQIAHSLLDAHFPESIHPDILSAVGLDVVVSERATRRRDPNFRGDVLTAYEYRCAVCGLDLRLRETVIGLEAAHIKWHQAGGPDTVDNGLALCVLHHKTFDLGAFALEPTLDLLVSEQVHGSQGTAETLLDFHGQKIREPQRPDAMPRPEFLAWHRKQVFKGQPRHH